MPNFQAKQVRRIRGEVIVHNSPKTATVKTNILKLHPKYRKRFTVNKYYLVHDENNEYKVGDIVQIENCRPISKRKRFKIVKKLG